MFPAIDPTPEVRTESNIKSENNLPHTSNDFYLTALNDDGVER